MICDIFLLVQIKSIDVEFGLNFYTRKFLYHFRRAKNKKSFVVFFQKLWQCLLANQTAKNFQKLWSQNNESY